MTDNVWDAVMCPACHWNTYDMRGISDRHEPPPRWCPECERHGQGRPTLILVTITAEVRS
jgi:NAD-dependent SIR2 family protein deacetylase